MRKRLKLQAGEDEADLRVRIEDVCERMEKIYEVGSYSKITVIRHWSKHNPNISGEIARPSAYRWYLRRELLKLVQQGAEIQIEPSHARIDLSSPSLLKKIDESDLSVRSGESRAFHTASGALHRNEARRFSALCPSDQLQDAHGCL